MHGKGTFWFVDGIATVLCHRLGLQLISWKTSGLCFLYTGKPNQPVFVSHVAEFIAELRDESCERLAEATIRNFETLFRQPVTV